MITITMLTDYFDAFTREGAYYISESLLFSSYWLLFLPLLNLQRTLVTRFSGIKNTVLASGVLSIIHLALYPAVIWVISLMFYEAVYGYTGTFEYGIRAYLVKTVIIYGLTSVLFRIYPGNSAPVKDDHDSAADDETSYMTSLIVDEPGNKKTAVPVSEVIYITSFTPYVNIFTATKKYLYSETLKSVESKLDKRRFMRIHKSHIVNLDKVKSYRSRLNGDYDLILSEGTVLRLSRNYAQEFKTVFEAGHRLT